VLGQVQGKNSQERKKKTKKKSTVISSQNKWIVKNPNSRRMKKRSPSSGQNRELVPGNWLEAPVLSPMMKVKLAHCFLGYE